MPKLEELYVANNAIASFSGYEGLPALKILHLRRNKIDKIDEELPELPALTYLNLRSNKFASLESILKVFQFPQVSDLNIINCPLEVQASSFQMLLGDILIKNTSIKRFCKHSITDTNKFEAVYLGQYRWEKAERQRIEEERLAKEKEDAENNQD